MLLYLKFLWNENFVPLSTDWWLLDCNPIVKVSFKHGGWIQWSFSRLNLNWWWPRAQCRSRKFGIFRDFQKLLGIFRDSWRDFKGKKWEFPDRFLKYFSGYFCLSQKTVQCLETALIVCQSGGCQKWRQWNVVLVGSSHSYHVTARVKCEFALVFYRLDNHYAFWGEYRFQHIVQMLLWFINILNTSDIYYAYIIQFFVYWNQ